MSHNLLIPIKRLRSLHVVFLNRTSQNLVALKMPKQQKLEKFAANIRMSFWATPVGDLRCNLSDVLVKYDKKFFVETHPKSKQHQGKLETNNNFQGKQNFLRLDQINFKEKVVSSFLEADIPLYDDDD